MPFILATVLIDMISIGIIMPVLPNWVGTFTESAEQTALWYGIVSFSFGAANFVFAPLLGALSDTLGRRPVLLLGLTGMAVSHMLTAFAPSLLIVVIARLLGGATQANLAVANAYVADVTEPSQRASRFGLLGAMMGIGFVIGPALGGQLSVVDLRLPFAVAAGLALLNSLYGYLVLPESLPTHSRRGFSLQHANAWNSLSKGVHKARLLSLIIGVNAMAQFAFATTWVLYSQHRFGWGPKESGLSMFAMGVATLLMQGLLTAVMGKRGKNQQLAWLGLFSALVAYMSFGLSQQAWLIYPVMLLHGAGFASTAAMQSEIVVHSDNDERGHSFGHLAALNAVAGMLAPMLGGGAIAAVANLPSNDWRLGAPMFVCAALQALALTLLLVQQRRLAIS